MGGYGSGRRGWRPVVEDGLTLNIYRLQKLGMLRPGNWSLQWSRVSTGEKTASISYRIDYDCSTITLSYTKTVDGEKQSVDEDVALDSTNTNFGGMRYWFLCRKCRRRCGKLYLPNGALYFRCRSCYNLTYESSNESHKFDGLFRHIAGNVGCSITDVKKALKNFS